jgi:hypothetical protein
MIVNGKHRNTELALKHLKALQRQHPNATVEIISRRNALGRHSKNGQYWYFEVTEHKLREEYVVHFDYGSRRANDLLRFQVHVTGPGASDEVALAEIRDHYANGTRWKKGWREKVIYWGHVPEGSGPQETVERDFSESPSGLLSDAANRGYSNLSQRKKIRGRATTKKNRSTGKRDKGR